MATTTYAGQQRILSYFFDDALSFRLILLNDSSSLTKSSTIVDFLKCELLNSEGYSRSSALSFSDPTNNTGTLTSNLPQISASFSASSAPLQHDRVALLEGGSAKANGTVASIASNACTVTAHGAVADDKVFFVSSGTYPTGISADTIYYVKSPATNTFEVAATAGGSTIVLGTSWTGTLTAHFANGTIITSQDRSPAVIINVGQSLPVTLDLGLKAA